MNTEQNTFKSEHAPEQNTPEQNKTAMIEEIIEQVIKQHKLPFTIKP